MGFPSFLTAVNHMMAVIFLQQRCSGRVSEEDERCGRTLGKHLTAACEGEVLSPVSC